MVLVKKKGGSTGFCVDYKKTINPVTKKSCYPIPQIDDILTYLGNAKYFTTLDMISGHWRIPIEESSKQLYIIIFKRHSIREKLTHTNFM